MNNIESMPAPVVSKIALVYESHCFYKSMLAERDKVHELLTAIRQQGGYYEIEHVLENEQWFTVYRMYPKAKS